MIEPNSEMSLAEWDGKTYVGGGYPAPRVSVNMVQAYDSAGNSWRSTAPLLLGVFLKRKLLAQSTPL